MDTETTETDVVTETNEGEGSGEEADVVKVPKADYDKLNQTLGSLKRELKDLKKPKEETKETPTETKPDQSDLLQKAFLRSAGITKEKETELALTTAKKWDMPIDKLVDDEDFQVKLEKLRTSEANALATSKVRGNGGTNQAKETVEYWIAKGTPPSPTDVPNRKLRAEIARALIASTKNTKQFYND